MDEGRKRVLAIVAGILVARHLKTTEDLTGVQFPLRRIPKRKSYMKCMVHSEMAVLLFCGVFLFAQSTPPSPEQKPEPPANSSVYAGEAIKAAQAAALAKRGGSGAASAATGPLDVLSDTQGVDFGPYLKRVVDVVRRNWYELIPESARAPILRKGKVDIEFAITKVGWVADMKTVGPSGDVELDRAAYGGITASSPFPPLPSEFSGQHLALRFHFFYNPAKVSISPTSDVQMLSGSSQRFLATVTGSTDSGVTWSLSGKGCSGDTCGEIADGLYMAPTVLPNPPSVTLKATSSDPNSVPASVVVHLVAAPKP